MRKPASRSWTGAGRPPLLCQPPKRWLGNNLRPPGRGSRKTCSTSGQEAASAPLTAGSSGPRTAARSSTAAMPDRISKALSGMSWCGIRSPARCKSSPIGSEASLDRTTVPAAAPVATWSETIRSLTVRAVARDARNSRCGVLPEAMAHPSPGSSSAAHAAPGSMDSSCSSGSPIDLAPVSVAAMLGPRTGAEALR
jgi:hypothetical protein